MATLFEFLPNSAEFNSASFPQPNIMNASARRAVLTFDAASPQYAMWTFIAPSPLTSPYKVKAVGSMATATTASVMLQFFIEAVPASVGGGACNLSTASYFDSANTTCAIGVPATTGCPFSASLQLVNTGSLGPGDICRLMFGRLATSASDDATGGYQLHAIDFGDNS